MSQSAAAAVDASLRFLETIRPSSGGLVTSSSDLDGRVLLLGDRWSGVFSPLAGADDAAASSALASLGGALDSLVADASALVAECRCASQSLSDSDDLLSPVMFNGTDDVPTLLDAERSFEEAAARIAAWRSDAMSPSEELRLSLGPRHEENDSDTALNVSSVVTVGDAEAEERSEALVEAALRLIGVMRPSRGRLFARLPEPDDRILAGWAALFECLDRRDGGLARAQLQLRIDEVRALVADTQTLIVESKAARDAALARLRAQAADARFAELLADDRHPPNLRAAVDEFRRGQPFGGRTLPPRVKAALDGLAAYHDDVRSLFDLGMVFNDFVAQFEQWHQGVGEGAQASDDDSQPGDASWTSEFALRTLAPGELLSSDLLDSALLESHEWPPDDALSGEVAPPDDDEQQPECAAPSAAEPKQSDAPQPPAPRPPVGEADVVGLVDEALRFVAILAPSSGALFSGALPDLEDRREALVSRLSLLFVPLARHPSDWVAAELRSHAPSLVSVAADAQSFVSHSLDVVRAVVERQRASLVSAGIALGDLFAFADLIGAGDVVPDVTRAIQTFGARPALEPLARCQGDVRAAFEVRVAFERFQRLYREWEEWTAEIEALERQLADVEHELADAEAASREDAEQLSSLLCLAQAGQLIVSHISALTVSLGTLDQHCRNTLGWITSRKFLAPSSCNSIAMQKPWEKYDLALAKLDDLVACYIGDEE